MEIKKQCRQFLGLAKDSFPADISVKAILLVIDETALLRPEVLAEPHISIQRSGYMDSKAHPVHEVQTHPTL